MGTHVPLPSPPPPESLFPIGPVGRPINERAASIGRKGLEACDAGAAAIGWARPPRPRSPGNSDLIGRT
ncbi:hypothetical protein chiPu_0027082, partial [Chiloscyllium punctatum]|nr:hypothetical protein [Chiloscyllium punctatum]